MSIRNKIITTYYTNIIYCKKSNLFSFKGLNDGQLKWFFKIFF